MSRSIRALTPARRDASLRRLRTLNRVLIGGAVAATGLLSDVAANAFPGHKRAVTTAAPASDRARADAGHSHVARRRHHHARRAHHRLHGPAHPPTATTTAAPVATTSAPPPASTPAPAPAPASTPAPAPAPAPAPSGPVVSGGS